ncbi:MAG TPA: site-2 protease family protein [Blastocatellia bacterium]|nr:site-2 protease family protein [Blastocatellia bacterium]
MTLNPKPFYLGRVFGIPIYAHYSWLPVFPFYAWAIASGLLPKEAPGLSVAQYWGLGVATTTLLFVSVLAHELAHATMARAEGLGTGNITLYMFGGLATLNGQPAQPKSEFKIAVVGPAASFLIGTIFFVAVEVLLRGTTHRAFGQVLRHLGLVNWFLAGFNILPGLPLDGGRVLRALIWRYNKNFRAATHQAIRSGLMIALTLIGAGIYSFIMVPDYGITGLWMTIIGLMIALMLGTTEGRNRGPWRVKRGTVEDVMNRDVVQIPPTMKITDFINKVLNNNYHTSFPVVQDRRLHGMLLLDELKQVPREDWSRFEAREVMRPVDASMFIEANMPIAQAQSMLTHNGLGRAVVLDSNGLIVGYVSLRDLPKTGADGASNRR